MPNYHIPNVNVIQFVNGNALSNGYGMGYLGQYINKNGDRIHLLAVLDNFVIKPMVLSSEFHMGMGNICILSWGL